MKTFLKILGALIMAVIFIKGIQVIIDHLYKIYGQKYVVTDINDVE